MNEPTQYPVDVADAADIDRRFTYHAPHGDQVERYSMLRDHARAYALLVAAFCPPSRERSLALTKIEESVMWANASIARNEAPPPRDVNDTGPSEARPS